MPPDWPQPHPYAQDFDQFWLVRGLPPRPWPALPDGEIDHQAYGPTGTEWLFQVSDYLNRITEAGVAQALGTAARVLQDEARAVTQPLSTTWGWRTPTGHESPAQADHDPPHQDAPRGPSMKVARVTIHAKLDADEEMAHVFHFRNDTADSPADPAAIVALATKCRDQWKTFLQHTPIPAGGGPSWQGYLHPGVTYDEVRAAYLNVVAGQRPTYDVVTQYVPFSPAMVGSDSSAPPLPYEVAMVMSLNSNYRGPRNRGRSYLGGFTTATLGPGGFFNTGICHEVGHKFGLDFVDAVNTGTPWQLCVASFKYATSVPVQGVRVGLVPDSQRRRRRSKLEQYFQAWGTPVGANVG